ncbi:MAG TPA: response regulator transcription factor [Terriglobales bacterium]|jgi:DNA-binding response OmpR family regulator|nr:response regulator transcription factor [Terriglobales bacterium]
MATAVLERSLSSPKIVPVLKSTKRILVIEHDAALRKVLHHLFSSEGYQVEFLPDAFPDVEALHEMTISALILDLGRVGASRCDLLRQIAGARPGLPLIVVSSNPDVKEKILVLELGADDYLTIPFSPRELLARVRAVMRRTSPSKPDTFYSFDGVVVDFSSMEVTRRGKALELTNKEFKTLDYLIKNARRVISRDELLNQVWGYHSYPCTRTVDNHILKLRQKLEDDPSNPSHFLTNYGVGYKFVP